MSTDSNCLFDDEIFFGVVKWFNNKSGYGFVSIISDSHNLLDTDVFVYHTSLRTTNDQYKYLVQGEYVEFNLTESTNEKYEFQAQNVTGIHGYKLMCETINDVKESKKQFYSEKVAASTNAASETVADEKANTGDAKKKRRASKRKNSKEEKDV